MPVLRHPADLSGVSGFLLSLLSCSFLLFRASRGIAILSLWSWVRGGMRPAYLDHAHTTGRNSITTQSVETRLRLRRSPAFGMHTQCHVPTKFVSQTLATETKRTGNWVAAAST